MSNLLITDRDEILNKLSQFEAVDYWNKPISKVFRIKFGFIQQAHQTHPFLANKKPLVKAPKEQEKIESTGDWYSYYQPSVSVAKRASSTPALDPTHSADSFEIALLCSVVIPSAKHLTPRQLRWLDLFSLSLVVLSSDSNVVTLFRSEYVFLRRLNVFTSAHPVKAISFPVKKFAPFTQSLMEQYSKQSILFPYFNKSMTENITADFMSCMTVNGFNQANFQENPWYQALATTYTGMMKRYERCHQLKGIVLAMMTTMPALANNPENINPFNIRFKEVHKETNALNTHKKSTKTQNEIKNKHLLTTMGAVGIYEVLLSKIPTSANLDDLRCGSIVDERDPLNALSFFLSSINSGIMPFGKLDTFLSQIFSKHLHNETYRQLLYNNANHLGFLSDVNKDDALLTLYLRVINDHQFIENNPEVLSALSQTSEPLDLLKVNFAN